MKVLTVQRLLLVSALVVFAVLGVLFASRVYELINRPSGAGGKQADRTELVNALACNPMAAFPTTLNWPGLQQLGEVLPSPPGWEVRYNATATLARRGSPKVPLAILCEMLDEETQLRNFRLPLKDGRMVANEEEALTTILVTLKAVVVWHKHPQAVAAVGRDNPQLAQLYQAIAKLSHSRSSTVRTRAKEVQLLLGGQ